MTRMPGMRLLIKAPLIRNSIIIASCAVKKKHENRTLRTNRAYYCI